jgi:hypothetical protein
MECYPLESHNRNLLRFLFLSPAAKGVLVDWNERASRVVAEFRADRGGHLDDPPTLRLLETLKSNSPAFARLWEEQEVKAREGGIRRFRSSNGKIVSYEQVALVPSARSDLRVIMLMPINRSARGSRSNLASWNRSVTSSELGFYIGLGAKEGLIYCSLAGKNLFAQILCLEVC